MWRGKSKVIAAALAAVLLVGASVGGTVAWLSVKSAPVVNTFTYGDINITLDETKLDENGNPVDENNDGIPDKTTTGNQYEMVPGNVIKKDPTVTVLPDNEACWLFVKLEEKCVVTEGNAYEFDDYLTYEVNTDIWTPLTDSDGNEVEGVYYCRVGEDTDGIGAACSVIGYTDDEGGFHENEMRVNETVTKEMLYALTEYPTLSVTAYAVQQDNIETAADAWAVFANDAEGDGADTPTEP